MPDTLPLLILITLFGIHKMATDGQSWHVNIEADNSTNTKGSMESVNVDESLMQV